MNDETKDLLLDLLSSTQAMQSRLIQLLAQRSDRGFENGQLTDHSPLSDKDRDHALSMLELHGRMLSKDVDKLNALLKQPV